MFSLLIPILALSIPIAALIYSYKIKKLQIESTDTDSAKIQKLEDRIKDLESTIQNMNGDIKQLEENHKFITKLLDKK